jgi:hypothetical protein
VPEAPHLITNPHAEVGIQNQPVAFKGRFGYEKIHARTGIVTERGEFDNLITDVGLNALGPGNHHVLNLVGHMAVGTGSNPPAVTDIQLQNEIARTSSSGGFSSASGYDVTDPARPFHWQRKVFLFTETQANGNLTELGTFNASGGGTLWNRQLFRDASGNPTVITKTSDEQLKLFYEWRVYPPVDAVTQVINVNGVDVTVTNRANAPHGTSSEWSTGVLTHFGLWDINGRIWENNTMPSLTANPSGNSYWASTYSTVGYVNNSLYRDGEMRWDPSAANSPSGQLGALTTGAHTGYASPFISTFAPRLTKTANDRVIIQTRVSWARAAV